jgi:predicted permease
MKILKRLELFVRALASRTAVESELDEEMRFHIDMAAEQNTRRGLPRDEAHRRARVAFGSVEQHKEALREGRGVRGIERIVFDLRFAARQLRMTPAFTLAAVLTLALGIGGNAVVFSVVNGVLLRPLPYAASDRLVSIGHHTRGGDLPPRMPNASATHVVYESATRSFEAMALYSHWSVSLTSDNAAPEWIDVVPTTHSLFAVLRVAPALGRVFSAEEDQPGGPRAVVISHALWQQRFGGDSALIGRAVTIDGRAHTVVGIMPASFAFPTRAVQLWVPLRIDRNDLGGFNMLGIARLRAGVSSEQAARELDVLLPRVSSLVDFLSPKTLRDAGVHPDVHPYIDDVVGGVRVVLWSLWCMTGLVLLIACVNVASLVLVRAETRRREVAIRVALGAERQHLIGQSLAESVMLVVAGSALGTAFASIALAVLPSLAPSIVPRLDNIGIDATVIGATTLIAAIVAVLFGLLPLSPTRSIAPASVFRAGDRSTTGDRRTARARQILVATQVAMATVLLVTSGLVLRSFVKLRAVDPGFRAEGVTTFRISLPSARYRKPEDVARFHDALLDRIRALPGVVAAGASNRLPLAGATVEMDPLRVEGRALSPRSLPALIEMRAATPGYFEAMGIPIIAGRNLQRADTDGPTGAVVITSAVVRKLMDARQPIGARVAHGLADVHDVKPWSDVVGVVGDVPGVSLGTEPIGAVYYAMRNRNGVDMEWLSRSMVYAVRGASSPSVLVASVRSTLAEMDAQLPLANVRTLSSVVDNARAGMRFSAIGFAVAAIIGLFMGAIGLYGVLSYVTTRRTREIGLRIALGAAPSSVRTDVVVGGLGVAATGLVVGALAALALGRIATPVLYGIAATDPITFAGVAAVLLLVAALAAWLPARRAANLDPTRALRAD